MLQASTKRHDEKYVLVTSVRDESATIERTFATVTRQSILPLQWIVVNDGSIDGTDEIVTSWASSIPWISHLRIMERQTRSFGAVARNINTGIKHLCNLDYSYIGILDADVELPEEYYPKLIERFARNPKLGLAGGVVIDVDKEKMRLPMNKQDVPGSVQFFRREAFEAIGELIAIPEGGWDMVTCLMARMNGYETRLFEDLVVGHLKPRNIAEGGIIRRKWQMGTRDYALGYHPAYEAVKCILRMMQEPYVIGSIAWWFGYCHSSFTKKQRYVDNCVVEYARHEQIKRMQDCLTKSIKQDIGNA